MKLCVSHSHKSRAWEVLDYEVLMLLGTSCLRAHSRPESESQAGLIKNALVESSLLHTRILVDIFLSRGSRPDDINLKDLGFDPSKQGVLAEKVDSLATVYGRPSDENSNCWIINKMLAHPTTHRSESYDYSKVFAALDKPLKALIEYIYSSAKRKLPFSIRS